MKKSVFSLKSEHPKSLNWELDAVIVLGTCTSKVFSKSWKKYMVLGTSGSLIGYFKAVTHKDVHI